MSARLERAVLRALETRFALRLPPALEGRVAHAAEALLRDGVVASMAELVERLRAADRGDDAVATLREAAAIGETRFFRDHQQLTRLARAVVERSAGGRRFSAWSAGCATGEEAWTLAALLSRALPEARIDVLGTDASARFVELAQRRRYPLRSARGVAPECLEGLVAPRDGELAVDPRWARKVRFSRHDLVTDELPRAGNGAGFDLISCRNVLMYIEEGAALEVMRRLSKALSPQGLLAVAATEVPTARACDSLEELSSGLFTPVRPTASATPAPRFVSMPAPSPALPASKPVFTSEPQSQPEVLDPLTAARHAADRGAFDAARALLDQLLQDSADCAEAHALLGSIELATGRPREAFVAFRRASFLDRASVAAELGLAQAHLALGQHPESRQHFERVLRLIGAHSDDTLVTGELSAGVVRRLVERVAPPSAPRGGR